MHRDLPLSMILRALKMLDAHGSMSRYDLARRLEVSDRHGLRIVQTMMAVGLVRQSDPGTPWSPGTPPTPAQYQLIRRTIRIRDLRVP